MSSTDSDDHEKTQDGEGTGAQGQGSAGSAAPFAPSKDDDSPVGSTDQHSKADHGKDPAEDIKTGQG